MTTDIKNIVEIVTSFDEFEHETLLNEIQGNILKSHGRNHAVYLFLKFQGDKEAAKQWIGHFSHMYVNSALEQAEQAKLYRHNKDVPGKLFANFFLTRAGYMHLGYTYQQLPNEDAFRQGMQDPNMQNELGDDSQQWEKGFQNEIHALVLLASDKIVGPRTKEAKLLEQKDQTKLRQQPALLAQKVEKIKQELAAIAEVVHEEQGYVLRDEKTGEEIEHFGFRDGVSQPLFLKRDIEKERQNSDFSKWDPRAPLNLVLFKDPLGQKDESYGSFLVFRKLEQNVGGWNKDVVENLAQKLKGSGTANPALAGAYTMGRFQDGTPVVLDQTSSGKQPEDNNFNYQDDQEGLKCPFHSHIRKVNPRGDTPVLLEEEKMHRIVRRGINYGDLPSQEPEKDAGLLFMCFQASLASQFNFMQKAWAKERNFVRRDVGTDIVIGVEKKNAQGDAATESYNWPAQWGATEKEKVDFTHWITMKGGEFFFAPSMSFLKSLAPEPSRNIVFRGVPKQEIEAANNIIAELRHYQQKNWAIGLNGDSTQPDGFLTFFNQRKLPFSFYLLNQVQLGDQSAYLTNINTLNKYIKDICAQEIDASEYKIAELKEYKCLNWAIGLNADTEQPDGFVNFFGERQLPFEFYVRSIPNRETGTKGVSMGDQSAYEKNITTLNNYITELKNL
ncbi:MULTISPECIES: Dyp-type peroxidase [Cyanophyceae]|uniref:Dyp-type peroxidase n=1 Tax=Cyanophyceae TaxID=3028117 RepID=UPI00232D0FBC|nr:MULTISPECIES: Dyp-type peroxidase [Cyanophyceae]MDB9356174.1 Dyp-type peroxidase [Nodularia spumigena CS-587/03]MDB9306407.1 Dyp-type peroxidase [Nodularia spumigena CS-591/12]MDB9341135.1 Dyp-type peroxidase [Nodularia spumigena CS-589/07]MDB9343761.1 Dyp-type peroxidase [Nodularia spumigena CS-588/06]MDB9347492.1 Dyp-type peroxidase [Nodularia spumigena CS-588/01]